MGLPILEFDKDWTASEGSGKYLPSIEEDEIQAREDLQVQHDNTKTWADALVAAISVPSNLGQGEYYSAIGEDLDNVLDALLSLKSQITEASRGVVQDHSIYSAKLTTAAQEEGPAVATENIQTGAVTSAKLSTVGTVAAVATANIQPQAVTQDKLASDETGVNAAVGSSNIMLNAVKERHIYAGAVTHDKIGSSAVETGNIKDANVTEGKLASGSVTDTKLADSAIIKVIQESRTIVSNKTVAAPTVGTIVKPGEMSSVTVHIPTFGACHPQPGAQSHTYYFSHANSTHNVTSAKGTSTSAAVVVSITNYAQLYFAFPTGSGTKVFTRNSGNSAWECGTESIAGSPDFESSYGFTYTGTAKAGHTITIEVAYAWQENGSTVDLSSKGISYTMSAAPVFEEGQTVTQFTVPFNMNAWTKPEWYGTSVGTLVGVSALTIDTDKFTKFYRTVGGFVFDYEKTLFTKATTASGIALSDIVINESTYLSAKPAQGSQVFTYSNSVWTPALATYGITIGTSQVESGDTITITTEHLWKEHDTTTRVTLSDIGVVPTVSAISASTSFSVAVTYTQPQSEAEFPFRGMFQEDAIEENDQLSIYFSKADAESGAYSSYCESNKNTTTDTSSEEETTNGYGYIFADELPSSSVVIPTVRILK